MTNFMFLDKIVHYNVALTLTAIGKKVFKIPGSYLLLFITLIGFAKEIYYDAYFDPFDIVFNYLGLFFGLLL